MRVQNTEYNPYIKARKNEEINQKQDKTLYTTVPQKQTDSYSFTTKSSIQNTNNNQSNLSNEFKEIKEQQGLIGKAWDGIKNFFGSKSGSNSVEETIKKYENGEISEEEARDALEKYKAGQDTCVDVVADMASGILAVGAFALAVPTGGASLAVGLTMATAVGAGVKVGIKAGDALANGKEYSGKDLLYDTATGGLNGLLAPITNGLGNTVTKTIGQKFGLKIIQEGAEEVAEQAVKQGFKQAAKSAILNQTLDVAGGTIGKRAVALGAGMALDGAMSGASDNMLRAALNGENVLKAGAEGFVGGLIMAPLIGGGFRVAGKAGNALNNKITMSKILPDGLSTKFKQGSVGDCALLSTIDGMMNNPQTAAKIKKSITKSIGGDYNVKIGDQVVRVAKSSLSDDMLSDKTGIRIFEQAYKQLTGNIDGGFAEVVAKQFGLNPVHIANDSITDELLDTLAKNQGDTVLSFGALVDEAGSITNTGGQRHYFTIKGIDADSKMVTLTSPIDTSKTIKLSYDEVKNMGISIDGGSVKDINLPNSTRNNSDIAFKGIERTRSDNETKKIIELLREIDSLKDLDESNIIKLIDDLDDGKVGAYNLVSPEKFQRIKNKALISSFKMQTVEVGGREIYLTPQQLKLYQKKMGEKLTPQNITKGYCGQVIMSDAMFIEATAVNLGLDISGKSTDEIFEEIGLMILDGKDIFPGITIQNKDEIADVFFGRFKHTDSIESVGEMGGDKAVHEINKALMGLFESDPTFQKNWIEYCATSPKFKQLSAIADTYKLQLREILGKEMSNKKAEALISQQIENEDHIIFRALQRDAIIDTDELQMVDWGDVECQSFIEILARKLLNHDTSEDFVGGILTRYGNKFDTITYKFQNWNWETDGIYIPQYAS